MRPLVLRMAVGLVVAAQGCGTAGDECAEWSMDGDCQTHQCHDANDKQ